MSKHLKISTIQRYAERLICPVYYKTLTPVQLPSNAFTKHLRNRNQVTSAPGYKAYVLPCGCFVLVHYSGVRFLSALPF